MTNTVNNAPQGLFHPDNFDTFVRVNYEEVGNKENSGVNMLRELPAVNKSVTIDEYKDAIIDDLNKRKDCSVQLLFAERSSTISEKSIIFNVDGMVKTKFTFPFSGAIHKDSKYKSFTVKAEIVFMQKRTSQKSVAISGEQLNYLENLPVDNRRNNAVTGELTIKEIFSNKEDMESMYSVDGVENLSSRTEKITRILDEMNNDKDSLGYKSSLSFGSKRNFDVSTLMVLDNNKAYVEITGQIEFTKGLIVPSTYDVVFKAII